MEGKITRYFQYRKINKYLKSKNTNYNCLDNILIYYINGKLQKILESYYFKKINIYPLISKKRGNYLQIECLFYNLTVDIGFDENVFDFIIYLPGISAEDFAKGIIQKEYDHDFEIEKFFEEFYNMLEKDGRLKK